MPRSVKALLPHWAQPEHPILQYELAHLRQGSSRRTRFLQLVLLALLLGGAGYLYASAVREPSGATNFASLLWRSLYFPTLLVQVITALAALALGVGSVESARMRQTWDNLRVTETGAEITLRARWLAILYRLRAPMLAFMLVRLCLSFAMIYDLSAFGGSYSSILSGNTSLPLVGWPGALLIVALLMTANLLLPLASIGFAAALGMLISVAVKQRLFALTIQALLSLGALAMITGLLLAVTTLLQNAAAVSAEIGFVVIFCFGAIGDWGLIFLRLDSLGKILNLVSDGVLLALLLVATPIGLAVAIDGCLALAARLAETHE